ncbi:MAG TPA: 1,6-anhydro-N-acetylmuramyl-L-alanine amidase AmpD [Gammaproteobacteria bacterium]|nr:1,6-anhydro-N-acetylmuramyl-L-alanine amidase AmpD [Gammaproteobacteria bacterium]
MQLDKNAEWLENVNRVVSPNCDARPDGAGIDLLVIHSISLPPGEYGGSYIDQLFTNTLSKEEHPYFAQVADLRVSSHLMINRRGRITQYVPFSSRAWHVGRSAFNGREECNDYSIGIELEGCDDTPYTREQYRVLAAVTRLLMSNWPAIKKDHIVGHCDIAPGRKTDPGPAFDWKAFFKLLDDESGNGDRI